MYLCAAMGPSGVCIGGFPTPLLPPPGGERGRPAGSPGDRSGVLSVHTLETWSSSIAWSSSSSTGSTTSCCSRRRISARDRLDS